LSYQSVVLAETSLVSFWELNEAAGATSAADSKGTDTGTPTAVTFGAAGGVPSSPDTAATFNGTTSFISIANLVSADTFTIEACIRKGVTGAVRGIISNGNASWYMRLTAADQIEVLKSQTSSLGTTTVTLDANVHHVVWTKATVTNHIYIDGIDVSPTFANAAMAAPTVTGSIGSDNNSAGTKVDFANGTIGCVAVYNAALTAAQVLAHYQAFAPATPTNLTQRMRARGR